MSQPVGFTSSQPNKQDNPPLDLNMKFGRCGLCDLVKPPALKVVICLQLVIQRPTLIPLLNSYTNPTPSLYIVSAQRPTSIPLLNCYTPHLFCTMTNFNTTIIQLHPPHSFFGCMQYKTFLTEIHPTCIWLYFYYLQVQVNQYHSFFVYRFCTTTNFNTTIIQPTTPHFFLVYHFCTTTNFNTTFKLRHPKSFLHNDQL